MKLTRARKYEKILHKTRGIFYKNPLLSLGLALPLAVIPSYNLIATTAVSMSMARVNSRFSSTRAVMKAVASSEK